MALPLSLEQMTNDPFMKPVKGPLTSQEVQEAQDLGILPQGPAERPEIPKAILPQTLAAQGGDPAATTSAPVNRPSGVAPVGRGGVPRVQLDPATPPQSPLGNSIAARRDMYNRQLEDANKPADYSKLQEQMKGRQAGARDDMFASVLAGIGPDAVKHMQEPILKQSMAARQPMKVEGGQIDESGQVMIDPAFQAAKKVDAIRNRLAQLDTLEARMASDADKAAIAHERNLLMGMIASMKAANSGNNVHANTVGFDPNGRRVIEDQRGNLIVENQDGTREAYRGAFTPKTDYNKQVGAAQDTMSSMNRAGELIKMVEANPNVFGIKASVVSHLPGMIQSRVMPKVVGPEGMALRGEILRQAAQEINKIYGAALTKSEANRSVQWALQGDESAVAIISKLNGAHDWAQKNLVTAGPAVEATARSRMGGQDGAPAGGANLAAAARAELAKRGQQ